MKKARQLLEFKHEFQLIGIRCALEDYKLCWHLNKSFGFDFERIQDLEVIFNGENIEFPLFGYEDQDNDAWYHLISNRNGGRILVPEEKQADYFLKISGEYGMVDLPELIKKIREIAPVITAYPIRLATLKTGAANLYF